MFTATLLQRAVHARPAIVAPRLPRLGLLAPRLPPPRLFASTFAATLAPTPFRGVLGRRPFSTGGGGPGAPPKPPPSRRVGYWLLLTAGGVAVMVVLGGVTRLTRSGLSITTWRPGGESFPRTPEAWETVFAAYRDTPEYRRVNNGMTLEEFKPIYWMEWVHRAWGRGLGLLYGLPLLAFAGAGAVPGLGGRLLGLLALGGGQGAVGYWMVASGLDEAQFVDPHAIPRVSPYRLAAHLTAAFTLYSGLVWTGLDVLSAHATPTPTLSRAASSAAASLTPLARLAAGVVATTVLSGAFVAGNDAGRAFNDWPHYAGRWVPEGVWESRLGLKNFFENTATVQFDHRNLAYASLASVGAVVVRAVSLGDALPRPVRAWALGMGGMACVQATLGVSALVMVVPPWLGAVHQAGALVTLTTALCLLHSLKRVGGAAPLPRTAGAVAAAAASMLLAVQPDEQD